LLEGRYGTMANSNFVVKNGLTVGALSIDAATGNITTSGTISGDLATTSIAKNDTSLALNDTGTGSDVAVTIDGTEIFTITGSGIIPSVDSDGSTGFSLGSASFAWKDVYVSSGSLYVNGQKVLQDDSGTIVVSADSDQNLSLQTSGSGNVELDPTGSGLISLKGTVQIEAGNNITSSDGNAISFSNSIDVDAIESRSTDTNLTLTANGTGIVYINDGLTVTGTISGTGASTSFADNILDLNADLTSGAPSENGGIRILRGDSNAATLLFNETSDVWQIFDGTNTHDIVGADDTQTLTNKTLASPTFTGTATGASATLSGNLTVSGDLTVSGTTTTVNTETINLADNVILINSNATGTPSENGGIEVERGDSSNVSFVWDETNDEWTTNAETLKTGHMLPETDVTYDLGSSSLKWRDLYLSGSTIKLGSATISADGSKIAAGGGFSGNADTASTWETARTLSLTGAVTGSASIDGSGNVSLATTATSDPTITLAGDASGSATLTNLGSATLTVTVADDSHNHVTSNIDGFDAAVRTEIEGADLDLGTNKILFSNVYSTTGDLPSASSYHGMFAHVHGEGAAYFAHSGNWVQLAKQNQSPTVTLTGAVTGSGTMTNLGNVSISTTATADPTLTLTGDVSGSATFTNLGNATLTATVANDSHSHSNYIASNANDTATGVITFSNTTAATSATTGAVKISGGLGVGGAIYAAGDVTAYSDDRLKTNVHEIENGLDKVMALRGITFERIADGSISTGVSAQDVHAVLPEAVSTDEEGLMAVKYGNLVGLLIEAIKDLKEEVNELKAEKGNTLH